MAGLAVSDIVSVAVTLAPIASQLRNFGALLIAGPSDVIDVTQRIRQYSTLGQVAADFASTTPEYQAATLFFDQAPQPAILYIGRWAQTATHGVLHGAVLSPAAQNTVLSSLTGVTAGSLQISIDGSGRSLTGLNLTSATTMNAVAAVIGSALGAAGTVTWNPVSGNFNIESNSTGPTSSVGYASPTGSGTDLSVMLGLTQAAGAQVPVAGIAAESALACATLLENASNDWYGLMFAAPTGSPLATSDHLAIAAFIQGASPSRIYGLTTQDANVLSPTATTDIAYLMQAGNYERVVTQYSSSSPYAVASLLGRAFTVNFQGNNTTITLKFQQEPGITAELLTESQAAAVRQKNCNVFVAYSNATAIIQEGVMANGYFFDEVQGTDWLQNAVQTAVFNLLYTRTTKVPQTDAGVNLIVNTIEAQLAQAVSNGLVAPGTWQGPAFGQIATGQVLAKGWYVYAQPVGQQNYADRVARKAPPIQVAIVLAGAVHFANVMINVTR